jgi:outer membrane protein insertion porin family
VLIFFVNRASASSQAFINPNSLVRLSRNRLYGLVLRPVAIMLAVIAVLAPQAHSQESQTLCQPEVIGNRHIPKETILARLFSHQGDLYDPQVVERDFNSLWNTGYFEDVRIERQDTPECIQLVVLVREKLTIREINYKGLNAVSQSDLLDAFKKAKVGISVESQYDPAKAIRAETVLKAILAEHGHQFATVRIETRDIPPAGVSLNFIIKEGPSVKVGRIEFEGNHALGKRELRSSMMNLKPIGIPHSIILEDLYPRTFDSSKLEEDSERVRQDYRDHGYFKALAGTPVTRVRNAGGINIFTLKPSNGKRVDILIPVEEGERYRLGTITFTGNKAFRNTKALRAQFANKDGDWFNDTMLEKGLEQLRKAYGDLGFINFVGTPTPVVDEAKHLVNVVVDIDEGKPFYVSRIEFSGNTVTRDKVIRRELQLEEGQVYNSRLWEFSLIRLNQLDYFDPLRVDQDSETHQNGDDGTVDLLLKVHEKGKNSIGLNGGISGLSGSFLGVNYQTNNFLGLGETLSVMANIGNLARNLSFGFTEPYFRNRPISLGFTVFDSKTDYNPAKSYSALAGGSANQNTTNALSSLATNYNSGTKGFNISIGYPIPRSFKRLAISYALTDAAVTAFNQNTTNLFQSLAFRSGISGQNQLNGILTSVITPTFSYSSIDRAYQPHSGKDFTAAVQIAGMGGNVKFIEPVVSYKEFKPIKGLHFEADGRNVLGYRFQVVHVEGFGGEVAPPTSRVYAGGESDLRGFDIRSVTPYVYIPTKVMFNLVNPDGTTVPRDPTNPSLGSVQIPLPIYRLVNIGGDTGITWNTEYRIPVFERATFSFFNDFGMNFNLRPSQLRESTLGQTAVTSPLYGCPQYVNGSCYGGQIVNFPYLLKTVGGTNYVPRDSVGVEVGMMMPVINAPLRIYYAYNPIRLYENVPQALAQSQTAFSSLFPCTNNTTQTTCANSHTGAGTFTYQEALQLYGANYLLREPKKTFRLTISTTF